MAEMPKMTKSPPELVERFRAVLGRHPDATQRQMFGYPAAFVGGNMATSLFAFDWVVRLSSEDQQELLAIPGARPFEPMAGRPMRGYLLLPDSVLADDAALDAWVGRALAFTASVPPKQK